MLCAWCSGEAMMYTGSAWAPPCCERTECEAASVGVVREVERWRDRMAAQLALREVNAGAPLSRLEERALSDEERANGWTDLYLARVATDEGPRWLRVLVQRADAETYGTGAWLVTVDASDGCRLPLVHRYAWEGAVRAALDECARWRWELLAMAAPDDTKDVRALSERAVYDACAAEADKEIARLRAELSATYPVLDAARHALATLQGLVAHDAAEPSEAFTLDESATIATIDAALAGRPPAPAWVPWVPWPTSTGYWWARSGPGGALCVVEARVESDPSRIYFSGVECPLYSNEAREPWEFCPAEPPR